jgi:hypothetical protein
MPDFDTRRLPEPDRADSICSWFPAGGIYPQSVSGETGSWFATAG